MSLWLEVMGSAGKLIGAGWRVLAGIWELSGRAEAEAAFLAGAFACSQGLRRAASCGGLELGFGGLQTWLLPEHIVPLPIAGAGTAWSEGTPTGVQPRGAFVLSLLT